MWASIKNGMHGRPFELRACMLYQVSVTGIFIPSLGGFYRTFVRQAIWCWLEPAEPRTVCIYYNIYQFYFQKPAHLAGILVLNKNIIFGIVLATTS